MILDQLSHHSQYAAIHPLFPAAFRFIETCDPTLEPGRYELSDGMYVMIQSYLTRPVEGAQFEAHRRYIDIQYVVEGRERMDYAPITDLEAGEYQPEKDYLPLQGGGLSLLVDAGRFVVFFPQDAHLPSRMVESPEAVKKIVVKVPVMD